MCKVSHLTMPGRSGGRVSSSCQWATRSARRAWRNLCLHSISVSHLLRYAVDHSASPSLPITSPRAKPVWTGVREGVIFGQIKVV